MKNKEAAVTLCPKRNYQAQNHWMTEHGQGVLRNCSTLSPSSKSKLAFTSVLHWHHQWCCYQEYAKIHSPVRQELNTAGPAQPCAPWRHRDLPLACKELTIRAGQEFYIGRANPSWHRRIRRSWRRSQCAKEMRRDGCTWEALMLQDSNVQPLSHQHKRSFRNVGIQLKSCQEASEGVFWKTRLKREVPKNAVSAASWRISLLPKAGVTAQLPGFSLAAHKFEVSPHGSVSLSGFEMVRGLFKASGWNTMLINHSRHLWESMKEVSVSQPIPTALKGKFRVSLEIARLSPLPACFRSLCIALGQPQTAPWTALEHAGCPSSLQQTPRAAAERPGFGVTPVSNVWTLHCELPRCICVVCDHPFAHWGHKSPVRAERIQMAQSPFHSAKDKAEMSTHTRRASRSTNVFLKSLLHIASQRTPLPTYLPC